MECCGEKIEAQVLTEYSARDGRYFQRRYPCPHCLNIEYDEPEYVKRTAERGNKPAHEKNNGRRGPLVSEADVVAALPPGEHLLARIMQIQNQDD